MIIQCPFFLDISKKLRGVKIVNRFLRGLTSYSHYARVLALREILEMTIFGDPGKYFGAKEKFDFNITDPLLLQQNHKQVLISSLTSIVLSCERLYFRN